MKKEKLLKDIEASVIPIVSKMFIEDRELKYMRRPFKKEFYEIFS